MNRLCSRVHVIFIKIRTTLSYRMESELPSLASNVEEAMSSTRGRRDMASSHRLLEMHVMQVGSRSSVWSFANASSFPRSLRPISGNAWPRKHSKNIAKSWVTQREHSLGNGAAIVQQRRLRIPRDLRGVHFWKQLASSSDHGQSEGAI